jgi:FAD/FMN-containing dehydrogenase
MQLKPGQSISNFGRNVEFKPLQSFQPKSVTEVLEILKAHKGQRIRVTGRLHSWSEAIVAEEIHLDLSQLDSIEIQQQSGRNFVIAGAGCQVKKILEELGKIGLTLPTIGLIDEQSIAGATATGTHGSGKPSLSHFVEAVEIAHYNSDGEPTVTTISSGQELKAARCSLGLMGIVLSLKFKCKPAYNVKEHNEKYDSLKRVLEAERRFPLQQFFLMPWSWTYYGHHRVESNESKSRSAFWYHAYWSIFIDRGLHVAVYAFAKLLPFNWLVRFFYKRILPFTIARNWKVVDDSHKMLTMEHELFRHVEIELFVTRTRLQEAIEFVIDAIAIFGGQKAPSANAKREIEFEKFKGHYCHHYPICVRRVLPDDTLISMASPDANYPKDNWYAISFISYQWPNRRQGFYEFADFLATTMVERFDARAHWGKYNPLSGAEIRRLYPRLAEFDSIRAKFDPQRQFENNWLAQVMDSGPARARSVDDKDVGALVDPPS